MLSLDRSLDFDLSRGEALPDVYRTLADAEIQLRKSEVTLTFGRSGAGKSIFALNHAIRVGVPALYISCDMDRYLTSVRAGAILAGKSTREIEEALSTAEGKEDVKRFLRGAPNLYFSYESRPTPEEVGEIIEAFTERFGIPPGLLVADNLMNFYPLGNDEWSGLREWSHVFHHFARDLGTAAHILHHANTSGLDLSKPPPMTAIKGQVHELQGLILGVAQVPGHLRIAAIKNRHGKDDPTGNSFVQLALDGPRVTLADPPKWEPGEYAETKQLAFA